MGRRRKGDPLPLSAGQLQALGCAAARELCWALPAGGRERRHWRRLAGRIPDRQLREEALRALARKRGNVAGAGLFATLPRSRNDDLLRALITFQTLADFLDNLNERHTALANGSQLHLALIDAVDPGRPLRDYYRHHPSSDDAGYLAALMERCRSACRALPSLDRMQPLLVRQATRAQQVFPLNHLPDPQRRDSALRRWAEGEAAAHEGRWRWFELNAAASSTFPIFVLLALAAEPHPSDRDIAAAYALYWPLMGLVGIMLDSFVDQPEDVENSEHRYVAHYAEAGLGVARLAELVEEAARSARAAPNGHRHAVVMSSMLAFYLAKDSARSPRLRLQARELLDAGGSLTRLLMPVLRAWRLAYGQGSA